MSFPILNQGSPTTGTQAVNAATWTFTYPPLIGNGDLLLAFAASGGNGFGDPGGSWPDDWLNFHSGPVGGATEGSTTLRGRIADGTETGDFSVTLANAVSSQGAWMIFAITAWHGCDFEVHANGQDSGGMGLNLPPRNSNLGFILQGSGTGSIGTAASQSYQQMNATSNATTPWPNPPEWLYFGALACFGSPTVTPTADPVPGRGRKSFNVSSGGASGMTLAVDAVEAGFGLYPPGSGMNWTISPSSPFRGHCMGVRALDRLRLGTARMPYAGRGASW